MANQIKTDDLEFYLPSCRAFVLLSELLLQVRETFRDFIDGLVQVAVLVVLRIEILLVTAALLARHNRAVLERVRLGFRFRRRSRKSHNVRRVRHVLGRHAVRTRVGRVGPIGGRRDPRRHDRRRLSRRRSRQLKASRSIMVLILRSMVVVLMLVVVVVVMLLLSWRQLRWLLLLLLLVVMVVLVVIMIVLLLLLLLLVMAGRRRTHFKRRTRPSGCHLLLSVP